MKMKRLLALALSLCMVLSLALSNVAYAAEPEEKLESQPLEISEVDGSDVSADLTKDNADASAAVVDEEILDADEEVRVIIVMEGNSIIEEDSSAVLDSKTEAKIADLEENQAAVVSEIEETVLEGERLDVDYNYTWLLNGVAATVPYGAIADIEAVDGVKQVLRQREYTPCETEVSNTVSPMTVSDGTMIGREPTWAAGYTGEGIKIAIIDTGLDTDHQNFQALDESVEVSATPETVAAVLDSLNAYSRYSGTLTVDKVYLSNKVAYAFDYGENDTSVDHDAAGGHGTHVAGIAAANKVEGSDVVGVAPDAQLYAMKVSDANGAMYDAYILAALEDALILGADVVNMSLGSAAGFTTGGEYMDAIYQRAATTGTILAVSAGNSYTMGYANAWGTNANLTSNPDNAVVATPSTLVNVLSVASVENASYMSAYITVDGYNLGYTDGSYGPNAPLSTLAGQELQIVAVPGVGEVSDYEGLDVEGKIALVQRGVISFAEKCENAEAAGAVACLVYNNVGGSLGIDLSTCAASIPCAGITLSDGAYLLAALEENPELTVTVGEGETIVPSDVGYHMSDFSSWGVAPDLSLEPDITAPGGNIYSTVDGGGYALMSGTSMASPNVAGISALVVQYAKEAYGLSGEELHSFVKTLLMSTSAPLAYDVDLYYSPRQQGSGLADAYNSITTEAYLTVDGCDVPKAELGDDPDRTGSYGFSFDVNNFGSRDLFYDLSSVAQTEGVDEIGGLYFMSSTPVALAAALSESSDSLVLRHDVDDSGAANSHDAYLIYQAAVAGNPADENWTDVAFRYNLDGNETVDADDVQAYLDALVDLDSPADLTAEVLKVAAGETASVSVSVTLDDADKEYLDTYYENGGYVEGFTFLTALNANGVDLSLPYVAFYGGWDEAPVIDCGFYHGESEEEMENIVRNQFFNVLWTQFYTESWIPGVNVYLDEEFDESHISLSPNGDLYADYIDDIYVSLLRNAGKITVTYTDTETGKVYSEEEFEYITKSYYLATYGNYLPFTYAYEGGYYDLTDENGEVLPNNTKLTLSIAAYIDYEGAEPDVWETPITVDTQAPELLDAELLTNPETGAYYVELTFRDNVSVAAVNFVNSRGMVVYGQYLAPDEEAEIDEDGNLVWTARYDVTGIGDHFTVALGDYALNESYYELKAPGNDVVLDSEVLYGYRVADSQIYNDSLYGWLSMQIVEDEDGATSVAAEALSSEYYMDYALTAAEQVGGYIIACDANNDLVWIRPGYWDERNVITHLDVQLRDLTYDPTTETLYGLTTGTARLVTVDIHTGELNFVGTSYLSSAMALACDDEGNLYGIYGMGISGQFRTVNKETGAWGETLATNADGMPGAYYNQSMTYKDGVFYWAQYGFSYGGYGDLYTIAQNEEGAWTPTKIGTIAGSAEVVGLLWLDTNEFEWPEETELESLTVTPEAQTILVGGSATLTAIQTPWYCGAEVEWSSSDESVASVNAAGVVTGVGVGSATITASSGGVSASATVSVVDPQTELTGFVFSSLDSGYSLYNQWVSFMANDPENYEVLTEMGDVNFVSAEYLDGVIYAYDETSSFYAIDPTDFSYSKINTMVSSQQVIDMAYDYTTGNMYGLVVDYNYGETYLVTVDLQTGRFQTVATLSDGKYSMAVGIAVDNNGVVYYVCSTYGFLCSYDPAADETNVIGLTGYIPYDYIQSMTYDHDTEKLYWAAFTSSSFSLMYLDQATGQALPLGTVAKEYGGAEIVGLHTVPENPPETPYVEVEGAYVTEDSITLVEGGSTVAPVEVLPYNATDREITWTVADESIASVDGVTVTALKAGTTIATGTVGGYTVELEINVVESVGAFHAYVLGDFIQGSMGYWMEMYDSDIHTPGQSDFLFWSDIDVYAAAYYDGYIWTYGEDPSDYEQSTSMHLRQIDPENGEIVADYTGYDYYLSIMDMAFDYSEGAMYAVGNTKNSEDNSTLYAFDLTDGQLYAVAPTSEYLVTLACSEDGQLYAINTNGVLFKLDKVTGELTEVGETGYPAHGYQSMAFDYDSGKLYWAQTNYVNSWFGDGAQDAAFLLVDTKDGSTLNLGATNAMLSGLYFPTEDEPEVPKTVEASSISLSASSLLLGEGESETLTAVLLPISVRDVAGEITFTSSDESVATVSANGTVTGVSAGKAVITASSGDITATCTVNVVGADAALYAVNGNGWESTALLDPTSALDSAALAEELGLTIVKAAYNTDDGYVYAVDEEGYLWKLTLDLGYAEQVGDVLGGVEDVYSVPKIIDLAYNPYAGGLYALVGDGEYNEYWDDWSFYDFYIYEVSTEDASSTQVGALSPDIGNAVGFTFNSADTVLVYDTYLDYVWEVGVNSWYGDAKRVLWAQQALAAEGENFAMTYSKELDRLFIVTVDWYYGSGNQALYMLNPENGSFGVVDDGAWTEQVVSLLLIEGAEPVTADNAAGTDAAVEPAGAEAEPSAEPEPAPAETDVLPENTDALKPEELGEPEPPEEEADV